MMKTIFLLITLISISFSTYAHEERSKQDLQVEIQVPLQNLKQTVRDLKKKNMDITYVGNRTGKIHMLLNQEDFSALRSAYKSLNTTRSTYVDDRPASEYKTYAEIQAIITQLQKEYPDLVHVVKIGKSLEGRDIIAARISNDKEFNPAEPAILFNALHHAREVMTVEIIQDIMESLTKGYQSDVTTKTWVDNLQIWIIPMVNPDGSNKVWTTDAMWRKNTRNNTGVDINRNYPYKWAACDGSSSDTGAQDYRGPSAGSEPETQVMMSFIEKVKPVYNISYHSYGEMVIHPYGCNGNLPNPADKVVETAKQLGALVKHDVGASWQILYDVDGGDIDWMYATHHVIPFVLEVSKRDDGFQPPYSRRDAVVQQNKVGWKFLLAKLSGVGMPSPSQPPTTLRWGRWMEQAKNSYKSKSLMQRSLSLNVVRIEKQNRGGWTPIFEHPVTPTKDTQHYLLAPGKYRARLKGGNGPFFKNVEFEVFAGQSDNTVTL